MQTKGKVTYKGNPKKLTKGYGVGFKLEGIEEFFNIWAFNEEQAKNKTDFNVGDVIEVDYEYNEEFNSNSVKRIVTEENPLVNPIKEEKPIQPQIYHAIPDIEVRKFALSLVQNMHWANLEEMIEFAQGLEHYIKSGEKVEFKSADKV